MQVSTILESIDMGAVALPEFQRGYVWTRKQVRNFMHSLYHRHPVGSLLVWLTPSESAPARGEGQLQAGHVKLLLDGQQRITTLYGIIKGKPPRFFDGDVNAITGLMFHLKNEIFEYYGPVKMKDDPYWINVTDVMQKGMGPYYTQLSKIPELQPFMEDAVNRLNAIISIKERVFHIEEVAGEGIKLEDVVDIFNNVNSGGTKLSKGDLALARVCAGWIDARDVMRRMLDGWQQSGFHFELDWLLRNVTTILTHQALFDGLEDAEPAAFKDSLEHAEKAINYTLNVVSGRLGLDHDRVLGGRYAIPVMTRYLTKRGGKLHDAAERDKLLYWYVHSFLWGRFAGSTESVMNQDLRVIAETESGYELDALIEQLRVWRGQLVVRPEDFAGWSLGARFYPMLYLLTRVGNALDWGSGIPLKEGLLGKLSRLNVHHIFPKAYLYEHGYTRYEVNALGNFCFLTQDTNLDISDTPPTEYFPRIEKAFPGALESQWVPLDKNLWEVDNYLEFLKVRQELLAQAANDFLDSLLVTAPEMIEEVPTEVTAGVTAELGGVSSDDEEHQLRECNDWVIRMGLTEGELAYELANDDGQLMAIIDLAWPDGLQKGLTGPVAVLLNESPEVEELVNQVGYRYFSRLEDFYAYVNHEILVANGEFA